jgi:hypothetical protein
VLGTLLTLVTLSAAPHRLVITPWTLSDLTPAFGQVLEDTLASDLRHEGFEVATPQDIAAILGQERQRQLLGCKEAGACLAELANALGCDGTVVVSLARLGDDFRGTARVLSSRDGHVLAETPVRATSETGLVDSLAEVAQALSAPLRPEGRGLRLSWLPAAVGGVFLAGAVVSFVEAGVRADQMAHAPSLDAATPLASEGKTFQTLAWVGGGVGLAGLVTSTVLWARDGASVSVAPVVSTQVQGLALQGRW